MKNRGFSCKLFMASVKPGEQRYQVTCQVKIIALLHQQASGKGVKSVCLCQVLVTSLCLRLSTLRKFVFLSVTV